MFSLFNGRLAKNGGASANRDARLSESSVDAYDAYAAYDAYVASVLKRAANRERVVRFNFDDKRWAA